MTLRDEWPREGEAGSLRCETVIHFCCFAPTQYTPTPDIRGQKIVVRYGLESWSSEFGFRAGESELVFIAKERDHDSRR
jgi:hypothetical protein